MDYIERMQESGLINFDEVNTRIKEMDDKRQAVIDDETTETVQVKQENFKNKEGAGDILPAVNKALKKTQENTQKQVKALQKTVTALSKKIEILEEELERTQKEQALQTQSQSSESRSPSTQQAKTHKKKNFKPKNSDYSSDDVKLDKIFQVN